MVLSIIKGSYRIQRSEPDGDAYFVPDDPAAFTTLHLRAQAHTDGEVQLRLDAIDTLETHYTPRVHGGFLQQQPLGLAEGAAARTIAISEWAT